MTWTVGTLTEVIARARLNHRSAGYIASLERRLAKTQEGEAAEAAPVVAAVESSASAAEAVAVFLDAGFALLDDAGAVGDEDAADVSELLHILGTWFEPRSREDEDATGG